MNSKTTDQGSNGNDYEVARISKYIAQIPDDQCLEIEAMLRSPEYRKGVEQLCVALQAVLDKR